MVGTKVGSDANASRAEEFELLARETKRPVAVVKRIYEAEFARLTTGARINDYVAVIASRRTREMLLRNQA
jgi:Protein of unknown function (DUF3562)